MLAYHYFSEQFFNLGEYVFRYLHVGRIPVRFCLALFVFINPLDFIAGAREVFDNGFELFRGSRGADDNCTTLIQVRGGVPLICRADHLDYQFQF